MRVWVYIDTSQQVGNKDHFRGTEAWLQENDPEGVTFEYLSRRWRRLIAYWPPF